MFDKSANWYDLLMNGEKFRLKTDSLNFEECERSFSLKKGLLEITTDYKIIEPNSPDAEPKFDFLDEMNIDWNALGKKSTTFNYVLKFFDNGRILLESYLLTSFLEVHMSYKIPYVQRSRNSRWI